MKIDKIELQNFRGLENFCVNLNGKSTIIFGINGVGKSTILRSLDLIFANIIKSITNSTKTLAQLENDDIMYGKSVSTIKTEIEFENEYILTYGRTIKRGRRPLRTHQKKELAEITNYFNDNYLTKDCDENTKDEKNMPIFVNYGVNRVVVEVPLRTSKMDNYIKLDAFDKAIDSKIDFRSLFTWFRYQEDIENQEKVRTNINYKDKELTAVKTAMIAMLEDMTEIKIDRKPLSMKVCKNGKFYKITQLSDGEKCTIALFGDLARRLALANPLLDNPLNGKGVVLIDELELHMHTSWQRKVLKQLRDVFPNIQFIITTHSPQILGEVDESYNLITLTKKENEIVDYQFYESLFGWDSNLILEDVMHTESVNLTIKTKVNEMYNAINEKKYNEAIELANLIDNLTNGHNSDTVKARMIISRGIRREKNK